MNERILTLKTWENMTLPTYLIDNHGFNESVEIMSLQIDEDSSDGNILIWIRNRGAKPISLTHQFISAWMNKEELNGEFGNETHGIKTTETLSSLNYTEKLSKRHNINRAS